MGHYKVISALTSRKIYAIAETITMLIYASIIARWKWSAQAMLEKGKR